MRVRRRPRPETPAPGAAVLILGRAIHPPWNEGARVIARSVAELAAARRPVSIVSLTEPSFLELARSSGLWHATHVPARATGAVGEHRALPAVLRAVRSTLSEQRFAVAHVIGLPLAVTPVLRHAGLRVIVHATLGGHAYQGTADRLRHAGGRIYDPWIDAYACASETVRQSLRATGHAERRLHVLGPPVDEQAFSRSGRAEARRALGLPADAFLVVYIGTVSPLRFPADIVAEALVQAAPRIPRLQLEAFAPVGTHGYNVGWARENVGRAAERSGAPMRVQLEDLSDARKVLAYSAADVVLLPFAAPVAVEPPLTLLEALSCEASVLVAPNANRSGIVEHARTGMTYDGPERLAGRLVELHALGDEGRAALGADGRKVVVRTFGQGASGATLERLWAAVGAT